MLNLIKTFFAKQFSTLYYFYQYIGLKIFFLLLFNFLSVLADGIGLTMFIPLLQIADGGVESAAGNDKMLHFVNDFVSFFGLPLNLVVMLILISVLFLLKALFVYFTMSYQTIVLQTFIKKIRVKNSNGLNELKYKEFITSDVGLLQNTLTGEVNQVVGACSSYLETIKNIMVVIVYLGFAFFMDWSFSLLIIAGGLISNFIYKGFYKKTASLSRDFTNLNNDYSGLVVQSVGQFKYLKATGRNQLFLQKMMRTLDLIVDNSIRSGKISAFLISIREPMMIIIVCAVIAIQVMVLEDSLSSVMVILLLFYRAMSYIISVQTTWNSYLTRIGSMDNMREFELYLNSNNENLGLTLDIVKSLDTIELKDLHLSFDTVKVLNGIDLKINKCSSIAFVGETGSGKSTLVNLIAGLIAPTAGNVLVNGRSVHDLSLMSYRSKIGYVSQDPTVFNGSIYDNVTFWAEPSSANKQKFWEVVDKVSLTQFMKSLPSQGDTLLGNNGLNLSGGQKQRISIARELFRDIDLLILDEATSALDAQTESEIKESLDQLKGEVTIITIAHRLSTIKDADIVYLLENGSIAHFGNFEELKFMSNYFRKLTELQGL